MNEKTDDRRVRKTKKALRLGLAELLAKKGLKDISVRELTDLVDLHRGTFYVHYRDIYDLYEKIEDEIVEEVGGILDAYPAEKIGDSPCPLILALFEYLADNQLMCRAMLSQNGDRTFVDKMSAIIYQKCLSDWMLLYKDCDPQKYDYFGAFIVSGCIGVLQKWLEDGMQQTPREVAAIVDEIIMQGVWFLRKPSERSAG